MESIPAADPALAAATQHAEAMGLALEAARAAEAHGDVPIGATIIDAAGEPIAVAGNERELRQDPTAHAEVLAIRAAAAALGGWRLPGTTLYVTLEPCAMCAGAIVLARIPTVVFGTPDPKAGACGSVLDVLADPALNHRPSVIRGVREPECAQLIRDFFIARRGSDPGRGPN
jgi:tRNA(adenine34) deaminase